MSSSSGLGNAGQANYSAAKEGIVGFTRTVARDLGRYGVTCNAIRPGAGTRLTLSDEMVEARKSRIDRGEITEEQAVAWGPSDPNDVAPFVVYLATDQAAGINGYDFGVAGGRVSLYSQPVEIRSIYKEGRWTLDELLTLAPTSLVAGLANPSPPL